MAFREQLMSAYGERVVLHPQDEDGLLDLAALLRTPRSDTLVYCCGPEPLLAAAEAQTAHWPPSPPPARRGSAARARQPSLKGSPTTATLCSERTNASQARS